MTLVKFSKYPWCSCILRLQQTSAISTSTTVNMKKLPKSEKYASIRRSQKSKWQKFLRKCDGFPTRAQAQWFQMAVGYRPSKKKFTGSDFTNFSSQVSTDLFKFHFRSFHSLHIQNLSNCCMYYVL